MAIAFGGGWWVARSVVSPAQRAARAQPPSAGPIFESVSNGRLVDQVSGQASIAYRDTVPIVGPTPGLAVVTGNPAVEADEVRSGSAIIEINGRPVFVFAGSFDFYRNLNMNDLGPDVTQLQRGLVAAGLTVTDPRGKFGASTSAAVHRLYQRNGYTPPEGFPLSEVIVVRNLPAALTRVERIGQHLNGSAAFGELGTGPRIITVGLKGSDFVKVRTGDTASFTPANGGQPIQSHVSAVSQTQDGTEQSVVLTAEEPLAPRSVGTPGVAIVTVSVVSGSGLIVPSRAVAYGTDNQARVVRRRGREPAEVIPVRVLGTLAGRSAIAPIVADAIRAGDAVQVS